MQDILVALRLLIELATVVGVIVTSWQSRRLVLATRRLEKDVEATPDKVIERLSNGGSVVFPCYKAPDDRLSS